MSNHPHNQNVGDEAGGFIKKGWNAFHGAGEAIRGNINAFADKSVEGISQNHQNQHSTTTAPNTGSVGASTGGTYEDRHAANKNEDIANKGLKEFESGIGAFRGHGHGTHSHGDGSGAGSTNYGPHDTNVGNAIDPRVDSDRSGTRAANDPGYGGSTNHGPHDSNFANAMDPRVDSDRSGTRAANDPSYEGSTNHGPHDSNIANAVDPRVDSDRSGNRAATTEGSYGNHQTGAPAPPAPGRY